MSIAAKKPEREIDRAQVAKLLRRHDGNITKVARLIGVDSLRLRRYVHGLSDLKAEMDEVLDRAVDGAVAVLFECMRDKSGAYRLAAAREFLKSDGGRQRGFGSREPAVEIKARRGGTLVLKWLDPEKPQESRAIEGNDGP